MIIHLCCISANIFRRNSQTTGSIIYLAIQGDGLQKFLNENFSPEPSLVFVNKVKQDATCKKQCNLEQEENHVVLVFNGKLQSCAQMFKDCINIKEIDVSKCDFSEVTSMSNMFEGCQNLEKIEFGNIATSSVTNMDSMFSGCTKLEEIDVTRFNTERVQSMNSCSNNVVK